MASNFGADDVQSLAKKTELWHPPAPESTKMWDFLQTTSQTSELRLTNYHDLHQWSIENVGLFWSKAWEYCGIRASQPAHKVVDEDAAMYPRPPFFQGAKLNFAQNLLFPLPKVDDNDVAVIAATETTRETVTWQELRSKVKECQAGLLALDVHQGDVVAGYVGNHTNALVAMLAVTSIGAIWTAISPDSGVFAALERLRQIEPHVLFADNAAIYNGKIHPVQRRTEEIARSLPSLKATVILETVQSYQLDLESVKPASGQAYSYEQFRQLGPIQETLRFAQLDADHPVFILYSSGTTGAPKCIVHGCIGTLLQHKKEHILHCSIGPASRFLQYTTCSWMMWNWLVSGLASGATIVLYDGSPFRSTTSPATITNSSIPSSLASDSQVDDLAMPRLISELQITHFGTSAKYLSLLEQKALFPQKPPHSISLTSLTAIYSTGSPLAPSTFEYTYAAFGPDLNLGSITGGTDIISLFGAPCPILPVHAGEIQCAGLGMAIRCFDPVSGADITNSGEPGDLVCVKPFPSQPVSFWGPDGESKYRASYFERFVDGRGRPVWHHGDFVKFEKGSRGIWMLGRSDGVLKPAGVRFGSAEIYNVVLKEFPGMFADALCVGRRRPSDMDETVVLFLKMEEGHELGDTLVAEVKAKIRDALSARHVPGIIDVCPEIPVTTNGKKVESAVKQILSGSDVPISSSVANASCLDWYRQWTRNHP